MPLWKLLLTSLKKELSFAKDSVELVVSIVRFPIFSPKFEVTLLQYLSNKAFIYIQVAKFDFRETVLNT